MRDGHNQTEISVVETIGGNLSVMWSHDEGTSYYLQLLPLGFAIMLDQFFIWVWLQ